MISIWNHFNPKRSRQSWTSADKRTRWRRCTAFAIGALRRLRQSEAPRHSFRLPTSGRLAREIVCKIVRPAGEKPLRRDATRTNSDLAQYARACGRVSVGGDLDKRPVNRPSKDRQPEANRRTPPNGGRDLKQRRTGLFWSLPALQRSAPKEACLSCRACGRDFLVQTMAPIA